MAGLPCAGTARRADRLVGRPLHPGQHLLIGSVPAALASRGRLHRPTYDPLASHLSLLSGGLQLRARSLAWTGRAATDETSSYRPHELMADLARVWAVVRRPD